ncbi:hypothetical protein KP509_02G021100 [Ceratopteris richardii]|uniref:BTB domain-containing protein n=1 Tax=Ceratopteris richardii TaxID=49495 RepID=A0A8T2VF80_CERRI|nr:hypothetical protein KP509_02G021100 [Ceratopteris richardii]
MAYTSKKWCSFCGRIPELSICKSCWWGGMDIIKLLEQLDAQEESNHDVNTETSGHRQNLSALASKARRLEDLAKRSTYSKKLLEALLKELYADIEQVTDEGLSLRAHKVVLSFGSGVFRSMLENKFIPRKGLRRRVPDLDHYELKGLVEFIYSGQLTPETLKGHSKSLIVVADKYDVPQLMNICEAYLLETLYTENAVGILELSVRLSSPAVLENAALDVILKNWKSIIFSNEYEEFALKNPPLALKVLRSYSIRKGF